MIYYIYILTSPSGKKYIGQTNDITKRFIFYRKYLCKDQVKLYNALLKYKWENFTTEIICYNNITRDELNILEIECIKTHNSFINGYNSSIGGEHGKQKYYTKEEKLIKTKELAKIRYLINYDKNKHRRQEYLKEYNNRPEVVERRKEYDKKRYELRNIKRNLKRKENIELYRQKEKLYRDNNKDKIKFRRELKKKVYENKRSVGQG